MVTESANAQSATMGPDGGSLSAMASDGTRYILEVSPGALMQGTAIKMTPVRSIRALGLSGGLAGAMTPTRSQR